MRVCVLLSRQSHRQSGVITNHNLSLSTRLMSTSISVDLHKTLHDQTSRSQEVWEVEVLIRIPNLGLTPSGLQPALIISGDYCNLTLGADQTEIPLKYNNWWLDTLQIQHVGRHVRAQSTLAHQVMEKRRKEWAEVVIFPLVSVRDVP